MEVKAGETHLFQTAKSQNDDIRRKVIHALSSSLDRVIVHQHSYGKKCNKDCRTETKEGSDADSNSTAAE